MIGWVLTRFRATISIGMSRCRRAGQRRWAAEAPEQSCRGCQTGAAAEGIGVDQPEPGAPACSPAGNVGQNPLGLSAGWPT